VGWNYTSCTCWCSILSPIENRGGVYRPPFLVEISTVFFNKYEETACMLVAAGIPSIASE
jgi:hypothetical protein